MFVEWAGHSFISRIHVEKRQDGQQPGRPAARSPVQCKSLKVVTVKAAWKFVTVTRAHASNRTEHKVHYFFGQKFPFCWKMFNNQLTRNSFNFKILKYRRRIVSSFPFSGKAFANSQSTMAIFLFNLKVF